MTLYTYDWPSEPGPPTIFRPLAARPYSQFFDSARPGHPLNRYSYICWSPFETITAKNGRVTLTQKKQGQRFQEQSFDKNPFDVLKERLRRYSFAPPQKGLPPFQGGAAGFFGYDLGRHLEAVPNIARDDPAMPDMCIGLYDQLIAFDHRRNRAWLFLHAPDRDTAEQKKEAIEKSLINTHPEKTKKETTRTAPARIENAAPSAASGRLNWQTECSDAAYLNKIKKIIQDIYAGEVYQVNLSRRTTADLAAGFDPYSHYCRLREINAAPFAAYLNFGNMQIASTSPESFLHLHDDHLETRPIKGTATAASGSDRLQSSVKDRAENTMIVDLLRNDLSRVCANHSVEVPRLCGVESFEGLHHLVSTVTGTLRKESDAIEALKACFPGGSITGAPKIRAMEIIEELEPGRRGPYCGAIGMIGFHGHMNTSIAIRTLIYHKGKVCLQTGSGIVADSNPEAELQETLDKGQKIFESFAPTSNDKEQAA